MPALWDIIKGRSPSPKKHYPASEVQMPNTLQRPDTPLTVRTASLCSDSIDISSIHTHSTVSHSEDYHRSLSDVVVVGAGPSGLLLADQLVRFGVKTIILDNRPERTTTGRADGIQPKTIETLRQMRLAEPLLRKGVKIFDISFWKSTPQSRLHRTDRQIHYPASSVDLLDPYCLLVHQGMVESLFVTDLEERGIEVQRNTAFVDFQYTPNKVRPLQVIAEENAEQTRKVYGTRFLVGCDGAHSQVRECLPNSRPVGFSKDAIWGVLDGILDTDFPDIWSKVIINSEEYGNILILPRERNITRLYIEVKPDSSESTTREELTQELVMQRAKDILEPYSISWRKVEWFGRYKIGQRVATQFTDAENKVFIAGDACHTHSPKAAQGMNTSMHDSWNLAWKMNFAVRGLARPSLLATYEPERKKIAEDLIHFDYEHADAFSASDPKVLAANFVKNIDFISGYGATYNYNVLNVQSKDDCIGTLKPGCLLPPAKVTRYVDANVVDIQSDIPALGQFKVFIFTHDVHSTKSFLGAFCGQQQSMSSFVGRLTFAGNASYALQPPLAAPHDEFVCPERYTPVSGIFTYALITDMHRDDVEIADLPPVLKDSRWTFYLDDVPDKDTRRQTCMDKWLDGLSQNEVVILNIRPDGYVGCLRRWSEGTRQNGLDAVRWMDDYYRAFMRDL